LPRPDVVSSVSHDALDAAVHPQLLDAATDTVPLPPFCAYTSAVVDSVDVQAAGASCVIDTVLPPDAVSTADREVLPVFAEAWMVIDPLPLPLEGVTVTHVAPLVTCQEQPASVVSVAVWLPPDAVKFALEGVTAYVQVAAAWFTVTVAPPVSVMVAVRRAPVGLASTE
jgi:hypothetical protein